MEINTSDAVESKQYICLFCCKVVQNVETNSFSGKSHANMKCVELQIQQKVDTLVRIMKEANRVPSRMKLVKQILEIQGEDEYNNYVKDRLNFIQSCTKGISRFFPKVVLEKSKTPDISMPAAFSHKQKLDVNVTDDSYCQWIISFIAITVLLIPTHSNSTETFSPEDCDIIFEDVSDEYFTPLEETAQEQIIHNHEFAKDPETEPCPIPPLPNIQTEIVEASIIDVDDDFSEIEQAPLEIETKISHESPEHDANSRNSQETDNSNDKVELQTSCKSNIANHQEEGTGNIILKEESNIEDQVAESDQEADTEVDTKPSILTKNSGLSLACSFCPRKLVNKSALSRHVYDHHGAKMPLVNKMRPYYCKLCKRGYLKYNSYFIHRKTSIHVRRLKNKQSRSGAFKDDIILIENPKTSIAREQKNSLRSNKCLFTELPEEVPVETSEQSISKMSENVDTNTSTIVDPPSAGYQLRKRRKVTVTSVTRTESSCDSESSISSDENYIKYSDSDSESSSCTSSDDTDVHENGTTVKEEKSVTKLRTRIYKRFARCSVNGCKYEAGTESLFKEHQKLHKQGQYSCMFCKSHPTTAFDLAMHETENHSKSNRKQKNPRIYFCSRCPYQGVRKLRYVEHFALFHLGLVSKEQCSICQVEMLPRYLKKHFENCHDTSKVGPEKILKCTEDNCSAYFISKWGLRQHTLEKHMGLEDEEETELGEFACNVCGKSFRHRGPLKLHKNRYHKQANDSDEILEPSRTQMNTLICTHASCTKSFPQMSDMEKHLTLHGSFKCEMCDEVEDYAPELAIHELEHDSELRFKKYSCQRCLYRTNIEGAYVTHHLETHLGLTDQPYPCTVCKQHCKSRKLLTSHFQNYHGDENMDLNSRKNCDKCTAYFLQDNQLLRHKITQHPDGFHCNISNCVAKFKTSSELETHKKLHGDFACQFCNIRKEYAEDIAIHELEHKKRDIRKGNKNSFKCPRCKFKTTANVHIYLHHFIEKHLNLSLKLHRCTICNASIKDKYSLKKHIKRTHCIEGVEPNKVQKCDKCSAYFLTVGQLLVHKRVTHDGIDTKNLRCVPCGKTFTNDSRLRHHHRKVHGFGKSDKAFEFGCDISKCDKRFQTKEELEWHKAYSVAPYHVRGSENHIQWKKPPPKEPITCEKCGKVLMGMSKLKMHMTKIHRPDRPTEYKCDKCDKVFKAKVGLQSHQEFHKAPEEWKYMCNICSKKCAFKQLLEQHMRTHSKEKPYVCQSCGEKYAHRHNLRNHVNSKHKDEGMQDIPKKVVKRFYVSRKGKKLGREYCFTRGEIDEEECTE